MAGRRGQGWGVEEAGSAPKLKLGSQNYIPGAGAVEEHKTRT